MTICREYVYRDNEGHPDVVPLGQCMTHMIFSLERRIWYCPECGNQVHVPLEQRSLNEYTRKS